MDILSILRSHGVAVGKKLKGNALDADVLATKTYSNVLGNDRVGSMPNNGNAPVITIGAANQNLPYGYYATPIVVPGDADLIAANIKYNIDVFGILGTFSYEAANPANSGDILSPKVAFVNGAKITGTLALTGSAVAANILITKTAYLTDPKVQVTGTMPNRAGDTAAIGSSVSGTTLKLLASDGYRDGVDDNVTITDADFVAANLRRNINLFGLSGGTAYGIGDTIPITSLGTVQRNTLYTTSGYTFDEMIPKVFDSVGNLYVKASGVNSLYKFNAAGAWVWTYDNGANGIYDICVDSNDYPWIASYTDQKMKKIDKTAGTLATSYNNSTAWPVQAIQVDSAGNIYIASNDKYVRKFNSAGVYQSQKLYTSNINAGGLKIGIDGYLYVLENTSASVKTVIKFATSDIVNFVWSTGMSSTSSVAFGIGVDSSGNVACITGYSTNATVSLRKITSGGSLTTIQLLSDGSGCSGLGLAMDSVGNIYVNYYGNTGPTYVCKKLDPTGLLLLWDESANISPNTRLVAIDNQGSYIFYNAAGNLVKKTQVQSILS